MNFFKAKIIEIVKETSDVYSFHLEIPEDFTWGPGQHCIFKLENPQLDEGDKPMRVFSIASAMEDNYLMFTTRIGELHTSYKENLLNLKPGDEILVSKPTGSFTIHEEYSKSFIIAGGIGITPIRSILKHLQNNNIENHLITVLYSDDRGEFAYKDDFAEIISCMENLDFHYISDRDEFVKLVEDYAKENLNEAEYLVAGSPGMNKAFSESLQSYGVEKSNIKLDNFMGY